MTMFVNISGKLLRMVFLCVAMAAYALPANSGVASMDMSETMQAENSTMNSHCADAVPADQLDENECNDCCEDGNCGCNWLSSTNLLNVSGNKSYQQAFHTFMDQNEGSILLGLSLNIPTPPPIS